MTTPTCETAGLEHRVCANGTTHTEERTVAATGHAWSSPAVVFSDDNTTATATWICGNDTTHKHTETCTLAKKESKTATCFEHEENVYAATAVIEGTTAFAIQTAAEDTPAIGHHFEGMTCTDCGTHLGDVNGNGKLNIVDAQLAYDICTHNAFTNTETYRAYCNAADVTGENGIPDGCIDAQDAFRIQYAILYGWDSQESMRATRCKTPTSPYTGLYSILQVAIAA